MLRIRLSRVGRKNQPFFKIVVIPRSASTKGGNFKAELGTHDPVNEETVINHEEARSWIAKGAQPTDTVHNLFIRHGVITGRKVAVHDKEPVEPKKEEKPKETKSEEKKESKEESKSEKKEKEAEKKDKKSKKEKKETEKKETENNKKETKSKKQEEKTGFESMDLTTRITNALEDAGIDSIDKLKEKTEEDLSEVKGLGKKSIEKIMDVLK